VQFTTLLGSVTHYQVVVQKKKFILPGSTCLELVTTWSFFLREDNVDKHYNSPISSHVNMGMEPYNGYSAYPRPVFGEFSL